MRWFADACCIWYLRSVCVIVCLGMFGPGYAFLLPTAMLILHFMAWFVCPRFPPSVMGFFLSLYSISNFSVQQTVCSPLCPSNKVFFGNPCQDKFNNCLTQKDPWGGNWESNATIIHVLVRGIRLFRNHFKQSGNSLFLLGGSRKCAEGAQGPPEHRQEA